MVWNAARSQYCQHRPAEFLDGVIDLGQRSEPKWDRRIDAADSPDHLQLPESPLVVFGAHISFLHREKSAALSGAAASRRRGPRGPRTRGTRPLRRPHARPSPATEQPQRSPQYWTDSQFRGMFRTMQPEVTQPRSKGR